MSLLDDLKNAAHAVDPQFQVSSNEVAPVLSALVHYTEHGQAFLDAVAQGETDVTNLLQPEPPEPPPEPEPVAPPADVTAPAMSDDELAAQISDLEAQLASRRATAQQTVSGDTV